MDTYNGDMEKHKEDLVLAGLLGLGSWISIGKSLGDHYKLAWCSWRERLRMRGPWDLIGGKSG